MSLYLKQTILSAMLCLAGTQATMAWDNNADAKLPQSSRRVVMMGNSITQYWLSHEVNNHKEFFTDNGALDRGVAGQTTPSMVNRFDADVVNLKPLVTVIAGGVNDINGGTTVDDVLANTKKMAEKAANAGIRPILATINPSGWGTTTVNKYIEYNKKIKEYADQKGFSFVNYFDVLTMGTVKGNFTYEGAYNEMKENYRGRADHSDHLHPSREGYLQMESVLIPLIESNIWKNGVYEAEHAVKKGNAIKDAADADASGGTRVGYIGVNNTLSFGYTAAKAGTYYLTVYYATGADRNLALTVNGAKTTTKCAASGGYNLNKRSQVTITVNLKQGYNTFVVGDQADDAPNIDKFAISNQPMVLAQKYKTFSVIGDSYSTYQGWMETGVDKDDAAAEYPQSKYDLTTVNQTWWKRFEEKSGVKLEQNNSISGTCMSYISLNGSGTTKTVSFVNRITKMRKADLFIIEGGTNDFSGGRTTYSQATDATINGKKIVGDYKWDGFQADMDDYRFVRPSVAYMIYYLQHTFPGCTVVFMTNNTIPQEGKDSFKEICKHYGAIYYEMSDVAKTNGHPLSAGMETIANQLYSTLANVAETPEPAAPVIDENTQFYLYNVGAQQWIKTGGLSKNPDSPALAAEAERTANVIVKQADGTYTIADPEFAPAAWGVQGRNTIYESNNGGVQTNSWGTTLIPGFTFTSTGDADGSVYIEYTWGQWTKGKLDIADPSNKTYALYYGDWALSTTGWNDTQKAEVENKSVYSDLTDNKAAHGAYAKWLIVPVKNGKIDVKQNSDTQFYLYNVGQNKWIKTGGLSKNPDSPALADLAERTANVIVKQADGTYTIADPEYAPAAWGVQGRNTIYESNNGSVKTNSWGTTLIPGFKFVSTGDNDGSVYIEYTWGQWTKGNVNITDPSNKTYALFYGDWALGTDGWSDAQKADVTAKGVYSDLQANEAAHNADAKWLIVPVANGKVDVQPAREPEVVVPVTPRTVSVTMSDNGVATYSSAYPLDFTSVLGVNAYIAAGFNIETGGILLTRVDEVPANTGLLLKGTKGTYDVPVQSNLWYVENLLSPAVTATTIYGQENGYVNYCLATSGANKVQFFAVEGSTQLAANRAYLHIPADSEAAKARVLNLEFEDEITGIKNVDRETNDGETRIYDLQGRQVRPAQKGLYIQNGKKVVINH